MRGGLVTDIDAVWPLIEGLVEKACLYNGGRYLAEDHLTLIKAGKSQLWITEDGEIYGVVITKIVSFPRKKCAVIEICTGKELHRWFHFVGLIEQWAKQHGAEQMFCPSRRGMDRMLKANGYQIKHSLSEKDL